MKVLIIPDVHLKPWIFDQAEDIMRDKGFERAVFIGDLVDDRDHESDVDLYEETFLRPTRFRRHVTEDLSATMSFAGWIL